MQGFDRPSGAVGGSEDSSQLLATPTRVGAPSRAWGSFLHPAGASRSDLTCCRHLPCHPSRRLP